jgi:hypothetical protein
VSVEIPEGFKKDPHNPGCYLGTRGYGEIRLYPFNDEHRSGWMWEFTVARARVTEGSKGWGYDSPRSALEGCEGSMRKVRSVLVRTMAPSDWKRTRALAQKAKTLGKAVAALDAAIAATNATTKALKERPRKR